MPLYHTSHRMINGKGQELTLTSASATSSGAFPTGTQIVRIMTKTAPVALEYGTVAQIAISSATSAGLYLGSSSELWLEAGEGNTLSLRSLAAAGTCNLSFFSS